MGISNWKLPAERRPASALPQRLCDPGRERHLPGPRAPSVAGETGPASSGTPQASAAAVPSLPIWTCRRRAVIATRQAAGGMFAQVRPVQQSAGVTTWEAAPAAAVTHCGSPGHRWLLYLHSDAVHGQGGGRRAAPLLTFCPSRLSSFSTALPPALTRRPESLPVHGSSVASRCPRGKASRVAGRARPPCLLSLPPGSCLGSPHPACPWEHCPRKPSLTSQLLPCHWACPQGYGRASSTGARGGYQARREPRAWHRLAQ